MKKIETMLTVAVLATAVAPAHSAQVIATDLIVKQSECIGLDCVSNESFGFDTLRLKENNLRIHFDDTSITGSFPDNDWRIVVNDTNNGGASRFSIEDATAGRAPFTIAAGAAVNALYIDRDGDVGVGTANPILPLHVVRGNTPGLRLEQDGSAGFARYTWDVAANETNFFVRDVNNSSALPFRIKAGAPGNSLSIGADGSLGVGAEPKDVTLSTDLYVKGDVNNHASIAIDSSNPTYTANLTFAKAGTATWFIQSENEYSADPDDDLVFWSRGGNGVLRLMQDGKIGFGVESPGYQIQHSSGARLNNGAWEDASSKSLKQDIKTLDIADATSAVMALQPVMFAYKSDPEEQRVGFIAEDVPALLATNDRKALSTIEIVAALSKVIQEQQQAISTLREQVAELRQRL